MELSERQKRWFWLMDYCKNNQLSPANRESWEKAEEAWKLYQKQQLKDIKVKRLYKGMKVKFKGDIGYGQDMSFWHGDFKDTIFTFVEKTPNGMMVFEPPGYGIPEDYGNGKIYVTDKYRDNIIRAD